MRLCTERISHDISIHVPIAGNDCDPGNCGKTDELFQSTFPLQGTTIRRHYILILLLFQSTFPLQGTTMRKVDVRPYCDISIHVPIAWNDKAIDDFKEKKKHFNPRSHCRERPYFARVYADLITFQSTFPLQGTTNAALYREDKPWHFNPRSHCRERLLPFLIIIQY